MISLVFLNIGKYFKSIIYIAVLFGISVSHAGSYDEFFRAIKRDDANAVTNLLNRGFDPNTLNPDGEHGLLLALREPSSKVISVLVNWPKINVEARSKQDESPLMLASFQGMFDICVQLIAKEADVNKPGWTPLHYAATNGHVEIISLLLENNAYIDSTSPNGTTPLMMAARYGSTDAVKALLEQGADPMPKNNQGLSALDFAQQASRPDAIEIISKFLRESHPKGSW
jgi:ankyrin repeat protein